MEVRTASPLDIEPLSLVMETDWLLSIRMVARCAGRLDCWLWVECCTCFAVSIPVMASRSVDRSGGGTNGMMSPSDRFDTFLTGGL